MGRGGSGAGDGLRLNIGGGTVRFEGYLTVDLREDCADVAADAGCLPYPDASVEAIIAHDIYEHVPRARAAEFLAEWARVLKPGGGLSLRCPNLHALAVQIAYWHDKPGPQLDDLITNLYGAGRFGPDGEWDRHFFGYTPTTLALELTKAGFLVLSNDESLNMTVRAVRV